MKLNNILLIILILFSAKLNSVNNQIPESKFDGQRNKISYVLTDESDESCREHCFSALRHFFWALLTPCRKKTNQIIIYQYTPLTDADEISYLNGVLEVNSLRRKSNFILKEVNID